VLLTGGGDAALAGLRNCLYEAMRMAGFGQRASSHFLPHMTLLYDRRMVAEQAIEPVYLTVRDFALVHSLVPQSRHIELARWPLRR
ncbi:MAG: RNA 2',3'-cyclic phosphodiesterase, partial [Nitrobacter sp.]